MVACHIISGDWHVGCSLPDGDPTAIRTSSTHTPVIIIPRVHIAEVHEDLLVKVFFNSLQKGEKVSASVQKLGILADRASAWRELSAALLHIDLAEEQQRSEYFKI